MKSVRIVIICKYENEKRGNNLFSVCSSIRVLVLQPHSAAISVFGPRGAANYAYKKSQISKNYLKCHRQILNDTINGLIHVTHMRQTNPTWSVSATGFNDNRTEISVNTIL